MKARFTYAITFVADMEKAIAFHRDVLGLTPKFTTPHWSEFDTGEVTLALHPATPESAAGTVQLGFSVDDGGKLYEARVENGLDFTSPPKPQAGALLARVRGSQGEEIVLSS